MISKGVTDDESNRAQKRYNRAECMVFRTLEMESRLVLGFEPKNLEGVATPHNDTLIVRAMVANYVVAQVFVDVGRSINILFWAALEQMKMNI